MEFRIKNLFTSKRKRSMHLLSKPTGRPLLIYSYYFFFFVIALNDHVDARMFGNEKSNVRSSRSI